MRRRLNSLRARMALILGCVLLVPFSYAVIQTVHAYNQERERVVQTLERTARLISSYQAEFFEETRRLLEDLRQQQDIAAIDGFACSATLIDVSGRSGRYGNFAVSDSTGHVRCSSTPALLDASLADRQWFQSLRGGRDFIVSDVLYGRVGNVRTIVAAVPFLDEDGSLRGTLSASIDLTALDERMGELALPENATVFLIDRRGEPLGQVPGRGGEAQTGWSERWEIGQLARAAGAATSQTREHRFLTAPIANTPLRVVVGLPAPDEWSVLERNLIAGLSGPILMLALAVAAIWIATDLLVNRHIASLARTARAYSGGNFAANPTVAGAPTELRELGDTFAAMAERIRAREAELKTSLEQKDVLLREIHHRVKNNLQIVTSLLNLRTRQVASPPARAALVEAQTRINALALVYRYLYEHSDLDVVDLDLLVRELSDLLYDSVAPTDDRIALKVETAPVQIGTARAIPIALWLTEAVTNGFRHGFPNRRRGTIDVHLRLADDRIELEVRDDGVGIGAEVERQRGAPGTGATEAGGTRAGALGLTLIAMLARQVGGEARTEGPPGTRVLLTFPRQIDRAGGGTSALC